MNISETKTRVTFRSWNCTTELLWIRVFKPINSTLCCNCDRNATDTIATTSSLSTVTGLLTSEHTPLTLTTKKEISTHLHRSTTETKTIETTHSPAFSSETSKDITTNIASHSPEEISSDSNEMPSASMIAGVSSVVVFVVHIVTVVCVVIKRKRSVPPKASGEDKAYINVNYNNEKKNASPVTSGDVLNLSLEDQTMHGYRELIFRNGDADEHEYTTPSDVTVLPPGVRETEKVLNVVANVYTNSKNISEEPYNRRTVLESRSLSVNYAKPLKLATAESPINKRKHYEDLNIINLIDAGEYSHLASFLHPKGDDAPEYQ